MTSEFFQFSPNLDMTGVLGSYLVGKILDKVFEDNKRLVEKNISGGTYTAEKEKPNQLFFQELIKTEEWCRTIKNHEFNLSAFITNLYVDLDILLAPKKTIISEVDEPPKLKFDKIFTKYKGHLVLLGDPGAGKTTLLKNFCATALRRIKRNKQIPLVILLRDIDDNFNKPHKGDFIFEYLARKLQITVNIPDYIQEINLQRDTLRHCVINFLDQWNIVLVLDGFDEIIQSSTKEKIVQEIDYLTKYATTCRILITSRFGEITPSNHLTYTFEVAELNEPQINQFVERYISEPEKRNAFTQEILKNPAADTAKRPLILAFYCYYYNHYGHLPSQPSALYSKVTRLLLEEWSRLNSVKRISKFSDFNFEIKFKFLREFAFKLSYEHVSLQFNTYRFEKIYEDIYERYGLNRDAYNEVLSEIQSHNGLIVQVAGDKFSFSHKSIQEYLAAEHLIRIKEIPNFDIPNIPNELAIATALSDDSNAFFNKLSFHARTFSQRQFADIYLRRVILEKPLFTTDPVLGIAYLNLYNFFKQIATQDRKPKPTWREDKTINNDIFKLLELKAIKAGVNMALGSYLKRVKVLQEDLAGKTYLYHLNKEISGFGVLVVPNYFVITDELINICAS